MQRNIELYPWFQFFRNLLFWQGIWFLYFQHQLSAAEAILLYAVYDIATTALEVPSGYLSDRVGRRVTLILATLAALAGCLLLVMGGNFAVFALGQIALGAGSAFGSGTDTSLLYESLDREGREAETESQELRAWRYSFTALAVSAVTGGAMASWGAEWAFLATALASAGAVAIACRLREPGPSPELEAEGPAQPLTAAKWLSGDNPALMWFFGLSVGMYVLSHIPFVFTQPFILEALGAIGFAQDAPVVSGSVTAAMMLVSVVTSWTAQPISRMIGRGALFLTALGMQVGLIGLLALTNHPLAIALLLLRMVPDSLARPFILARLHRLLSDRRRATYLSFQSFCGRLIFALSLIALSTKTSEGTRLPYEEIQQILVWYLWAGLVLLAALILTLRAQRETA